MKSNYVYMLKCRDGTYYTGWTTDVARRVETHNAGLGAKYTKARLPVELVFFEEYATKGEAMSRECEIKRLTRIEKTQLIDANGILDKF